MMTKQENGTRIFKRMMIGLCMTVGIAGVANAEPTITVSSGNGTTQSRAVEIGDLNLADPGARRTLEHRIAYAADRVCDWNPTFGLRQPRDFTRCHDNAVAGANAQVRQAYALRGGTTRAGR